MKIIDHNNKFNLTPFFLFVRPNSNFSAHDQGQKRTSKLVSENQGWHFKGKINFMYKACEMARKYHGL